jgi:polyferredoxin
MTKIKKPTGLIRYASMNQIINKIGFRYTPRLIGYTIVFLILSGSVITGIVRRPAVETTILRSPGMLYQKQDDGSITNLYNINLVNKTFVDMPISLKLKGIEGSLKIMGDTLNVPAKEILDAVFIIRVPNEILRTNKNKISIEVYSGHTKLDEIQTTFIGPVIMHNESDSLDQSKQHP